MVILRPEKYTDVATLKYQLGGLSARGALVCLAQKHGKAQTTFVWFSQLYTVTQALENVSDYLLDMRCGDFGVIRFFGGPPRNGKWFDGTLLTMLCDAVMFENHTAGMTEAQIIGL